MALVTPAAAALLAIGAIQRGCGDCGDSKRGVVWLHTIGTYGVASLSVGAAPITRSVPAGDSVLAL